MDRRFVKLSKFLALILRHQPERFGLALDGEGWTSLAEVMEILHGLPNFRWATREDVMRIVEQGSGDGKRRFEVEEGRIRARYGHSLDRLIQHEPCSPPRRLYHGTSPRALGPIREEGLRPMGRQYVHLSGDPETAAQVGRRHADRPIVLTIRAAEAHEAGVQFYQAGKGVYLVEQIPPDFVQEQEEEQAT